MIEVVTDPLDARVVVENPRKRVGAIALVVNALVPVVERLDLGLALDQARPRILAWRLVEMSVDDGFEHGGFRKRAAARLARR